MMEKSKRLRAHFSRNGLATQDDLGMALVPIILIVMLLTTTGGVLLFHVDSQLSDSYLIKDRNQALAFAESGLQETIWYLMNKNGDWTGDSPTEHPIIQSGATIGTYTVAVTNVPLINPKVVTIDVIGYVPNMAQRRARAEIEVQGTLTLGAQEGGSGGTDPVYQYALYIGTPPPVLPTFYVDANYSIGGAIPNKIRLSGLINSPVKAHIQGDLFARPSVTFLGGQGKAVDGTVYTEGVVTSSAWIGSYATNTQPLQPALPAPVLDQNAEAIYRSNAEVILTPTYPTVLSGNIDLGNHLTDDGDIFVDDDLVFQGDIDIEGKGYIVATGDITITDDVLVDGSGVINIITFENFIYDQNSTSRLQGIYYANKQFQLKRGNLELKNGAIGVGESLLITPPALLHIHYDPRATDPNKNSDSLGLIKQGGTWVQTYWKEK